MKGKIIFAAAAVLLISGCAGSHCRGDSVAGLSESSMPYGTTGGDCNCRTFQPMPPAPAPVSDYKGDVPNYKGEIK